VSPERLNEAVAAGLSDFGENRVQEAEQKQPVVEGARWHLIGHLQSNKAARAVALFAEIQSIDSLELAQRVGRMATDADKAPYPVYLQVNVDADPAKGGFAPGALETELPSILGVDGLIVTGLMTVGRLVDRPEDARPTFRRLRELSARLQAADRRIGPGLSMGMSDDFEVAVEEGATVVRLGRVLFGERPPA
jgi:pyridoxal phosphate enzyme (YggS family)